MTYHINISYKIKIKSKLIRKLINKNNVLIYKNKLYVTEECNLIYILYEIDLINNKKIKITAHPYRDYAIHNDVLYSYFIDTPKQEIKYSQIDLSTSTQH